MAADNTMQTVLVIGVVGAGGYLFYEYSQYSSAINTLATAGTQAGIPGTVQSYAQQLEQILPFFTWLAMRWGGTGTAQQTEIYQNLQQALAGQLTVGTQAPGTTSSTQTTSVSTSPGTTTTTTASSSPSVSPLTPARTYAPAGSGLAPTVSSRFPITTRSTATLTRTNAPVRTKI